MDVKVKVDLTEKEYMRFGFYCQRKLMMWVPLVATVIVFCATIMDLRATLNVHCEMCKTHHYVAVCLTALITGVIVGVMLFLFAVLVAFLRGRYEWKSSVPVRGVIEATFSDGGVCQVSEVGTVNLSYDKLYRVCEIKTAFYVYVSSVQAMIVPKRCFESAEDTKAVRELFARSVDKKKLSLRK